MRLQARTGLTSNIIHITSSNHSKLHQSVSFFMLTHTIPPSQHLRLRHDEAQICWESSKRFDFVFESEELTAAESSFAMALVNSAETTAWRKGINQTQRDYHSFDTRAFALAMTTGSSNASERPS